MGFWKRDFSLLLGQFLSLFCNGVLLILKKMMMLGSFLCKRDNRVRSSGGSHQI